MKIDESKSKPKPKRIAYWLDKFQPSPTRKDAYRVCLITEDMPGYYIMGNESRGQAPWYWDEETCAEQNEKLGNTPMDVAKIIGSSMAASRKTP